MAFLSAQSFLKDFKPTEVKPLYLLHGAEIFFLSQLVKRMQEQIIPDFEKGFNEFVLFGKDLSVGDVLANARRFPMMAEKQLVLIKDAHLIQDIGNKDALAMLENYAKSPLQSTVLVMLFGKLQDEKKTWVKAFAEKGEVIQSKALYDNQVPDFIIAYVKDKKLRISPPASQLLYEHIGNNLETLAKEIDKIALNLSENAELNADIIQEFVGISKEYNVFELQKAIAQKNTLVCSKILNYFAANAKDNPIQQVVILLYNYFTKVLLVQSSQNKSDAHLASLLKVNPYFVKDYTKAASNYSMGHTLDIIGKIRAIDAASKGVDSGTKTEKDLYNELIISFMA